jgi:two-component system chemotaxis response regulator CheY
MVVKNIARILIADDDELLREILKTMLSDFEVIEADSGRRAVILYQMHRPDVVLMDIVMPEMDGIEATKEIIKLDPDAVVIAISAYAPTKGRNMLEAGAKEVISKPIRRNELVEKIKKYIA